MLTRLRTSIDRVVLVVVLFVTTLGPVYTVRNRYGSPPVGAWEDDRWVKLFFGVTFVVATAWFLRRSSTRRGLLARDCLPLISLGVLAPLSGLWSVGPRVSLDRGLLFLATIVTGLCIGSHFADRHLARATQLANGLGVALSIAAVHWRPARSLDVTGAWTGIYYNRNSLSPVASLAVLASLTLLVRERGWLARALDLVVIGVSVHTLIRSGSRTAEISLLIAMTLLVAVWFARGASRRVRAAIGVGASVAAVAALVGRGRLLELLGRDSSLESRTPLWHFTWHEFTDRPLQGWGFYSYWGAPETAYRARITLEWYPPTAHNGLLETLLGLGTVGGLLLVASLSITAWRIVHPDHAAARDRGPVFAAGAFVYAVVANMTESFVLPNQQILLLLAAATAALAVRPGGADDQLVGGEDGPAPVAATMPSPA